MKIAVLDSTAVVESGPGSPAYFSRYVIGRLKRLGHDVVVAGGFVEGLCAEADLVWTEWANQDAFAAAASGVCKRLIVRVRGFDAHGPIDKLAWENVDAVVFESPFLRDFVEIDRDIMSIHHCQRVVMIPSGMDLVNAKFSRRPESTRPIVALAARTTNDKGLQLVYEWARQRPEVEIHMALALPETSVRLQRYLDEARPKNIRVWYGIDDVPTWLNEIAATHILSASIWETLGYSIAEGMAVGCRPLIHRAPGTAVNWPVEHLWTSFDDLDNLLYEKIDSELYRKYVEDRYDEEKCSIEFMKLIASIEARNVDVNNLRYTYERNVMQQAAAARTDMSKDVSLAAALVEEYRRRWPANNRFSEFRYMAACDIAGAYLMRDDLDRASMWTCRAMLDAPWPDAMCLMGEIAFKRGDIENALSWYEASRAVDDPPRRFRLPIVDQRDQRAKDIAQIWRDAQTFEASGVAEEFAVVVTVRNAEKWILKCLQSIAAQSSRHTFKCLVIDDVSTDKTAEIALEFAAQDKRFQVHRNLERKYQARNTVEGARLVTYNPDDVIVLVDGDDWLREDALDIIYERYRDGAWMTYGNFETSSGKRSHIGPYPSRIARAGEFGNWSWQATAPRTFKRFLLDHLTDDDFKSEGEWPKVAGDVSVMLPMLELSCERALPIVEAIYVYNDETPDSDHKQGPSEQVRVRDLLMERPKKARLEKP